jgi:hypothetical protein
VRKVPGSDGGQTSNSSLLHPVAHSCAVHFQTLDREDEGPSDADDGLDGGLFTTW